MLYSISVYFIYPPSLPLSTHVFILVAILITVTLPLDATISTPPTNTIMYHGMHDIRMSTLILLPCAFPQRLQDALLDLARIETERKKAELDRESIVAAHTAALHALERTVQDTEQKNLIFSNSNTTLSNTVEDLGVKLSVSEGEKEELKSQLEALKLSGDVTSVLDTQKVSMRLYRILLYSTVLNIRALFSYLSCGPGIQISSAKLHISPDSNFFFFHLLLFQFEINRLLGEISRLHTDGLQKDTELHRITVSLNKKDGENAGIRSSVSSLEEELSVLRSEIDGLEKQSSLENRKNKELLREIESLKSALTVEKGEVDNLTFRNEILLVSQSRGNTPSKSPAPAPASVVAATR